MTRQLKELDRVKITYQNTLKITLPRRCQKIKDLFDGATWVIFYEDLETGDIIIKPDGRRVLIEGGEER